MGGVGGMVGGRQEGTGRVCQPQAACRLDRHALVDLPCINCRATALLIPPFQPPPRSIAFGFGLVCLQRPSSPALNLTPPRFHPLKRHPCRCP